MARPDVTGIARYDAKPVDPLVDHQCGISRGNIASSVIAAAAFGAPYSSFRISWDFPEVKFGATGYEIEASRMADFEDGIPMAEKEHTGLSHSGAAGIFTHENIISINPYAGGSNAMQPDTQYYVRVRAILAEGFSAWSEGLTMSTAVLPQGTDPNLAPIVSVTATHVPGDTFLTIAPVTAVNPVTLVPLYDGRMYAKNKGGTTPVRAEGVTLSPVVNNGMTTVYLMVVDEDSQVAWAATKVMVTGIV